MNLLPRASADRSFNPTRISTTGGLAYTNAGVAGDGSELLPQRGEWTFAAANVSLPFAT